jgi:hypothetical protein
VCTRWNSSNACRDKWTGWRSTLAGIRSFGKGFQQGDAQGLCLELIPPSLGIISPGILESPPSFPVCVCLSGTQLRGLGTDWPTADLAPMGHGCDIRAWHLPSLTCPFESGTVRKAQASRQPRHWVVMSHRQSNQASWQQAVSSNLTRAWISAIKWFSESSATIHPLDMARFLIPPRKASLTSQNCYCMSATQHV